MSSVFATTVGQPATGGKRSGSKGVSTNDPLAPFHRCEQATQTKKYSRCAVRKEKLEHLCPVKRNEILHAVEYCMRSCCGYSSVVLAAGNTCRAHKVHRISNLPSLLTASRRLVVFINTFIHPTCMNLYVSGRTRNSSLGPPGTPKRAPKSKQGLKNPFLFSDTLTPSIF